MDMDIISAEEAAEAAKGMTFEKVWAILMEDRKQMQKSKEIAEKQLQESKELVEKQLQESKELAEKQLQAAEKRLQAVEKEIQESRERSEKEMKESRERSEKQMQETQKIVDKLSSNIGGIGNTLGEFTESMFSGALWEKFADYGIPVHRQSTRMRFGEGKGASKRTLAEADVFIENGEYAIPVEVKTKLDVDDVDDHLERIGIIRGYLDTHGDKRKLLGAVAGGVVPEKVIKYAHKNGLFVIVQSGDSVTIASAPEGFTAREW